MILADRKRQTIVGILQVEFPKIKDLGTKENLGNIKEAMCYLGTVEVCFKRYIKTNIEIKSCQTKTRK